MALLRIVKLIIKNSKMALLSIKQIIKKALRLIRKANRIIINNRKVPELR